MMKSKALFPISVDSQRFTTDETITALNQIKKEYEHIIFLIADGLQLYNKVSQVDTGKPLNNIIKRFKLKNDYYVEREKWLNNLRPKIININASWIIINIFSISDNVFHNIYRNVFISYLALPDFKNDIEETAISHRNKINSDFSKMDLDLSIAYVIEEIALNLRLRVIEKIQDEYYIGELPKPLVKLYKNGYSVDIFTLCGVDKYIMDFKFFHCPIKQNNFSWTEV